MLKVLEVIPLPNPDGNIWFSMSRSISSAIMDDAFYFTNFVSSIDSENTRRVIIVAIFEKENIKLLLEIYALITKNMDVFPILMKYRDIKNPLSISNDLVILSNIRDLYNFGLISYREDNYGTSNKFIHRINIDTIYDRIIPKFFWEIQEYSKDPAYNCFTKLMLPDYSYSLIDKLEMAIHKNDLVRLNKIDRNISGLFNNFEYILFNIDNQWDTKIIRELKYQMIDNSYVTSIVKFHRRIPTMISMPKLIHIEPTNEYHVTSSSIDLYRDLMFSISDFHIVFHDITLSSKLEIIYAYSSLMIDSISEKELKRSFTRLRQNILKFIYEYRFEKSKIPIKVDIIKNFYGEVRLIVTLHNEIPYIFNMDLFLFPLASEGIDIKF